MIVVTGEVNRAMTSSVAVVVSGLIGRGGSCSIVVVSGGFAKLRSLFVV